MAKNPLESLHASGWSKTNVEERLNSIRCPFDALERANVYFILKNAGLLRIAPDDRGLETHAGRGYFYRLLPAEWQDRWQITDERKDSIKFINKNIHPHNPAIVLDVRTHLDQIPSNSQRVVVSLNGIDLHPPQEKRSIIQSLHRTLKQDGVFLALLNVGPNIWATIPHDPNIFWAYDVLSKEQGGQDYFGQQIVKAFPMKQILDAYLTYPPRKGSIADYLIQAQFDERLISAGLHIQISDLAQVLDAPNIMAAMAELYDWIKACQAKGLPMTEGRDYIVLQEHNKQVVSAMRNTGFRQIREYFAGTAKVFNGDQARATLGSRYQQFRGRALNYAFGTTFQSPAPDIGPNDVKVIDRWYVIEGIK